MNTVKYFELRKKMCDSFREQNCDECPMNGRQTGFEGRCVDFQQEHPEKAAKIVGDWYAAIPRYTNLNHVADGLRKLGFVVDDKALGNMCPPDKHMYFSLKRNACDRKCRECKKWWKEEYRED